MPLIEITSPPGAVARTAKEGLSQAVADALLRWTELPATAFFRSATWVHLQEFGDNDFRTGTGSADQEFLVRITALEGLLDERRHEGLATELTGILREAAGLAAGEGVVWTIVLDVPEGNWSVNGQLTRQERIDRLVAAGHAELSGVPAPAG